MKANEIRKKFIEYFESVGHEKISSSPLIPHNDPTLLFANAGMNQFKDYFTGNATPKNKRAVTIQKCVRAGGKHNDLENVGLTPRHHTFFEMLGNFSFGDYFKVEAIEFAWHFLTNVLGLSKDLLYITCHESDEQAYAIWKDKIGVPEDRIFYKGDKDNFWEMGEIGPCGPCSEIFYDHGENFSDGKKHRELIDDESRFIEIWNLVFMQYEKYYDADEVKRKALPSPCVDTGAGLERLSAALQSKYWNYDTDLFTPIFKRLSEITGATYDNNKNSFRVVADHVKSSTMLITDGVIPSNEGRGYVLRRIIRRCVRHINEMGITKVIMPELVESVFDILKDEYPQNASNIALAKNYLKLEEEKFRKTLSVGLQLLNSEIDKVKGQIFSGSVAFKLYDTYGFPLDLTETILSERKLSVDLEEFQQEMDNQKERSRKNSSFKAKGLDQKVYYEIKEEHGDSKFVGYETDKLESHLIKVIESKDYLELFFNSTPFYGESGGQKGDIGQIFKDGKFIAMVTDTQKPIDGLISHIINFKDPKNEYLKGNLDVFKVNDNYTLEIDSFRRKLITRNHSATHLLQSALVQVLGEHVKQAGSSVLDTRLRFDFTHHKAMTDEEISKVEELVNKNIQLSLEVTTHNMHIDEAREFGALALFGEKYADRVRVLKMGEFSIELCGGTHVNNTSDIGPFIINVETSLASGIRRIEAMTSYTAFNYLKQRSRALKDVEKLLSVSSKQVTPKIQDMLEQTKKLKGKIKELNTELQSAKQEELKEEKIKISENTSLVHIDALDASPKEFRSLSDKLIEKNKTDVLLITKASPTPSYLLRVHKSNSDFNCSDILKKAQVVISGRGGGRPDLAQGSSNDSSRGSSNDSSRGSSNDSSRGSSKDSSQAIEKLKNEIINLLKNTI